MVWQEVLELKSHPADLELGLVHSQTGAHLRGHQRSSLVRTWTKRIKLHFLIYPLVMTNIAMV